MSTEAPTAPITADPSPSTAPATSTPPPAGPSPLIGTDGTFVKGWSKLLETSEALEAKFTSPKALAKSYVDLEKLITAKGIIKPGPNATPEQVEAYYNQLGRPATAKDYGLAKPETVTIDGKPVPVPAEIWDQKFADEAAAQFHALGITKEQGAKLNEWFAARTLGAKGNVDAMIQQARATATNALKAEFGANYEATIRNAQEAGLKMGLTPEQMKDPAFGDNPAIIRLLANVHKAIGETPSAQPRGNSAVTSNPAQRIKEIMNDKNHPWHAHNANKDPVAHKEAVAEMKELFKAKHGEA